MLHRLIILLQRQRTPFNRGRVGGPRDLARASKGCVGGGKVQWGSAGGPAASLLRWEAAQFAPRLCAMHELLSCAPPGCREPCVAQLSLRAQYKRVLEYLSRYGIR